ncbi:MAG: ABC transporter ATP-binding protein [Ancrocorticia sp.]
MTLLDKTAVATAIVASNIVKSYQVGDSSVEILHGVSLEVVTGEMVAVMGASGSGKSTLMYCLAGLEEPTSGTVRIGNQKLSKLSRAQLAEIRRSDVGFVFQSYNLIPTLTATENISLPFTLAKKKAPQDKIDEVLKKLGLAERASALPPAMSGGEQQRVALARVLVQQPEIIFADEPTGALDSRTGEVVLSELVNIAHCCGHCVLVVTHDPKVAAAADRVLFMRDGILVNEIRGGSMELIAATLAGLNWSES